MSRPKLPAEQKRNPHKIWLNKAEEEAIKAAALAAGMPYAEWVRHIALQFCDPSKLVSRPLETASVAVMRPLETEFHDPSKLAQSTSAAKRSSSSKTAATSVAERPAAPVKPEKAPAGTGVVATSSHSSKNGRNSQDVDTTPRTRAGARPVHIRSETVGTEGTEEEELNGSSLRSEQRSALEPGVESDPTPESPWTAPPETKTGILLSDGTRATANWLFANAHRLTPHDTGRILAMADHNVIRRSMLRGFAQSLRAVWIRRWCAAYNRRVNAWRDTQRASNAFDRAAAVLAQEYARRGMKPDQYIDAAVELRPKSLKFPTVDMLGGMLAERIQAWLPVEQREHSKPWEAHEDPEGHTWLHLPDDAQPVLVIRTAEDRALLMKMAGVK